MNVFICIDAFKGSMSSMEAGNACTAGIRRVFSEADITSLSSHRKKPLKYRQK